MSALRSRTLRFRTAVAVVLLGIAVALAGLSASGSLGTVRGGLAGVLAPAQAWLTRQYNVLGDFFTSPRDTRALRERNVQLEQRVAELELQLLQSQQQQAELNVLRSLLNYAASAPTNRYLAADVIGFDTDPFVKYIILNRGSDDGVTRDMPVVTNAGLVGRVTEVTGNAAKVQLIVDPDSAVNVRVLSTRAEGVAVGQLTGDLSLEFITQDTPLAVGDKVVTSGLGGSYPADVPVGEVVSLRSEAQQIFQQAVLRPSVDFGSLEVVLVLINFRPADIAPFQQATPAPQ